MTVSVENPVSFYVPTGSALGPFSTVFSFGAVADLVVSIEVDGAPGAALVLDVDYTVATSAAPGGGYTGDVTLAAAPIGGWQTGAVRRVVLERHSVDEQDQPFGSVDGFRPPAAEAAWDLRTRRSQELHARAARGVTVPPGEPAFQMPLPVLRANRVLGFDPVGAPRMYEPGSEVTDSRNVNYQQATGKRVTVVSDAITGWNDVRDKLAYGVDPDDILTDYTAATTAAVSSGPGGLVPASFRARMPPGYVRYNSAVQMTTAGAVLEGHGAGSTMYAETHGFNHVEVRAGDCTIQDLRIHADNFGLAQQFGIRTFEAGTGLKLFNLLLTNLYSGIDHEAVNLMMDSLSISGLKPGLGVAIRINHEGANVLGSKIFAGDGSNNPGAQAYAGILVIACGCLQLSLLQFFKMGTAFYAQPVDGSTAGAIQIDNSQFDTSINGMIFDALDGYITEPVIASTWASGHLESGITTKGAVTGLIATGLRTSSNDGPGRKYDKLYGFSDTGGMSANNGGSGALLGDVKNGILDLMSGQEGGGGLPGNDGYGYEILNLAADRLRIRGGAWGNALGQYSNLSTGSDIIISL